MKNSDAIEFTNIKTLDEFFKYTQDIGSKDKRISNTLYGINQEKVGTSLPENKDDYGLTFFTRPQLNLRNINLRNNRKFYSMLTNSEYNIHRYVRNMLDPRLWHQGISTPLVDNEQAFIPILTNVLETLSGWPDEVLPTYTSKQGVRKEQWGIGDGIIEINESFDLQATFKNLQDEPVTLLLSTWLMYISNVFEGIVAPYNDIRFMNEIDYNTRIYRIVLDENKRIVKGIAATGASFPTINPTGKKFDYNRKLKYNDQMKEINCRFKCFGAMYNDDILVEEFNATTAIFNPTIRKMLKGQSHSMVRIPYDLLSMFKYRGYPIINKKTMELEWWINKNSITYKSALSKFKEEFKQTNKLPT